MGGGGGICDSFLVFFRFGGNCLTLGFDAPLLILRLGRLLRSSLVVPAAPHCCLEYTHSCSRAFIDAIIIYICTRCLPEFERPNFRQLTAARGREDRVYAAFPHSFTWVSPAPNIFGLCPSASLYLQIRDRTFSPAAIILLGFAGIRKYVYPCVCAACVVDQSQVFSCFNTKIIPLSNLLTQFRVGETRGKKTRSCCHNRNRKLQ